MRFVAKASFPVITFGPFPTPEALLTSLGKAIGMLLQDHSRIYDLRSV